MRDQAERLRTLVDRLKGQAPGALHLEPGTKVEILVDEGLHRGTFESEVLQIGTSTLLVTMPRHEGKLVFLTAGTPAVLRASGQEVAIEVMERRFTPVASLVCSAPGTSAARKEQQNNTSHTRVISITSGKGGVGKTNLAVNLALAAQELGQRTLVFDADLGLANIDIVLGVLPQYNLTHVLRGDKSIREVICRGPKDLPIIAGGSGVAELVNLAEWQLAKFINGLNELEDLADLILIDTGAGLSHTVMSFLYAASEVIVVTTPEPTSITDAYAIVKLLSRRKDCQVRVLVNRAQGQWEAEATYEKLSKAAGRFLGFSISFLGWLPEDPTVAQAVKRQKAFFLEYADGPAAMAVRHVAAELFPGGSSPAPTPGLKGFFTKLARFLGS